MIYFYNTAINGGTLLIEDVTAIYNPTLTSSFINQWRVLHERLLNNTELFNTKEGSSRKEREFVEKHYEEISHSFLWNKSIDIPILPVCHGTDHYIAEKISQTGFATLSTTDAGYYGRGIYFSTHSQYTFPYYMSRDNPSLLISYIIPGNPYPVIEHHQKKGNLVGQALKAGFNSHYVLCNKDGNVISQIDDLDQDSIYNEFVISQESQIVPAFIIDFDISNFAQFAEEWRRQVPSKRSRVEETKDSNLNMNVV